MDNPQVSRALERTADLMELGGENPFKVRAFRSAARAVADLTEDLHVLSERGELRSIPGVGETIGARVRELLETGECAALKELEAEIPIGLCDVLALPGIGLKKVQALWRGARVTGLSDLEALARDGRLRLVTGFTERSEGAVIEAIAAYRRRSARLPIEAASRAACEWAARVAVAASQPELSGQLRRRQDLVDTIRLLLPSEAPEALRLSLLTLDWVSEGPEGGLALSGFGLPDAELILCRTHEAGAARLLATGSRDYVDWLKHHAGGALPGGESEAAVFSALGLPELPPELREGAARASWDQSLAIPLIDLGDYLGSLHNHSTWSDGLVSVDEMAEAARSRNHSYIAITDHSKSLGVARGLDEARLASQGVEIQALRTRLRGSFRVFRGIECDILADGEMDLAEEALRDLDLVVGSVHLHQRMDRDTMTRRVLAALRTGLIDILAHPTGRILGARDPFPIDLEAVAECAAELDIALEMNAAPARLDLSAEAARMASARGCKISINPDAHRPGELGRVEWGISQARRAGLTAADVINTWDADRVSAWLASRRRGETWKRAGA